MSETEEEEEEEKRKVVEKHQTSIKTIPIVKE
jgi:hypothetical protein